MANTQKSKSLLIPILIGIGVGILIGGLLPGVGSSLEFIGQLFLRGLLMLVVPVVMTSMISSIGGLGDVRQLGSIGGKTIVFYTITTGIAVLIGLIMVNITQPGVANTDAERVALRGGQILTENPYRIEKDIITVEGTNFQRAYDDRYNVILLDQNEIRGAIKPGKRPSDNSLVISQWTDLEDEPVTPNLSGRGLKVDLAVVARVKSKEDNSISSVLKEVVVGLLPRNLFQAMVENDILPLIIVSLVFGGLLTTMGEIGENIIRLVVGLNEAMMKMVHLILLGAPVGIGALIASRLGLAGGFSGFAAEFASLSKYAACVIIALLIHGVIVLPIILKVFGKRNPWPYARKTAPALTTAFSTASSSATLPLTMECAIEGNHISHRTASFVLPLGATVNMDGTALYEAVGAIFIAQIYGIELQVGQMIVIFLTATLAAIGAAGIPEAGLVTMVIVLQAVNVPIEGVSLILVIDWFIDRCRTTINVWGDSVGAGVIETLESSTTDRVIGNEEAQVGINSKLM